MNVASKFRTAMVFAIFAIAVPSSAHAQFVSPPGTVETRHIFAVDNRPVFGIGFNSAFIDVGGGNPFGAYYKTLVQEGYIYRVRTWNGRTSQYTYMWLYSWNGEGEMAPYDMIRQFYGVGAMINDGY